MKRSGGEENDGISEHTQLAHPPNVYVYDTQQPLMQWVHTSLCHAAGVASLALHPLDARSRMQVAGEGAADRSNRESCGNVNTHTQAVENVAQSHRCDQQAAVWHGCTNTGQSVAM